MWKTYEIWNFMSRFFIDSTIWVEFFKGNKDIRDLLLPLIEKDKIVYNGVVLSELLIGTLNEKEFAFIKSNFEGFHFMDMDYAVFTQTSHLGFILRRKGITVPLSDLIIAAHCLAERLTLISLDNHFQLIAEKTELTLKIPEFKSA